MGINQLILKRCYLLLIAGIMTLTACRSRYTLVRSNRSEYPIDSNLKIDSGIIKTYAPYKKQLDLQMNGVIGHTTQELTKSYDLSETLLGNFFSDAVLTEGKKIDPSIDFSIPSTKGGLRNNLPKGDIHLSDVFELMPFENELIVTQLSGADVGALINYIAASGGQPVAGIRLKISEGRPQEVLINGQPFNASKAYYVLTSDYIASGGDNSKGFGHPLAKKVLGLKVRDALINYIKNTTASGKSINAELDGRITKN